MSSSNLFAMSQKKRTAFLECLANAGVTPDLAMRMCKADARALREWVRDAPVQAERFTYDTTKILGFIKGPRFRDQPPEAEPGEMIITYGGWSVDDLYNNAIVVTNGLLDFLCSFHTAADSEETRSWISASMEPGIYRLRFLRSSDKELLDRRNELLDGEEIAPTCLILSALLPHQLLTGRTLTEDICCMESPRVIRLQKDRHHHTIAISLTWGGDFRMVGYRMIA